MKQSTKTIAAALLKRLEAGDSVAKLSASLGAYLIEERRVADVPLIVRDVERLMAEDHDQLYVHVTSAYELTSELKTELTKLFDAKHVVLEETIDPSIVGGVRAETADQRVDATIRRQLQRLTATSA